NQFLRAAFFAQRFVQRLDIFVLLDIVLKLLDRLILAFAIEEGGQLLRRLIRLFTVGCDRFVQCCVHGLKFVLATFVFLRHSRRNVLKPFDDFVGFGLKFRVKETRLGGVGGVGLAKLRLERLKLRFRLIVDVGPGVHVGDELQAPLFGSSRDKLLCIGFLFVALQTLVCGVVFQRLIGL